MQAHSKVLGVWIRDLVDSQIIGHIRHLTLSIRLLTDDLWRRRTFDG